METVDGIDHLSTTLIIVPAGTPTDGDVGDFLLSYDVITHHDADHEVVVLASGMNAGPAIIGTLGGGQDTIVIASAHAVTGLVDVVGLGYEHVVEGADHLLFLIVLLLPITTAAATRPSPTGETASKDGRLWVPRGRSIGTAVRHILTVATAFTVGHSLTLALAALGWVSAPSGPVEVLIAVSIGVGAVHAIRPIVRNGEAVIAAGFGLIHGLAFAEILQNLNLDTGSTAFTLLAFNLGVEMAQLVTVALVAPSLFVLGRTALAPVVRCGGAAIALTASFGLLADRLLGLTNPVAPIEQLLIDRPFVAVGLLAAVAVAAHTTVGLRQRSNRLAHGPQGPQPADRDRRISQFADDAMMGPDSLSV